MTRNTAERPRFLPLVVAALVLGLASAGPALAQRNDDRDDRPGRGNQRQDKADNNGRGPPMARPGIRNDGQDRDRRRDRGYTPDRDYRGPVVRQPPAPGWRDNGPGRGNDAWRESNRWRDSGRGAGPDHRFYRGSRLTPQYRNRSYIVDDWRGHRLYAPPRGQQWVQVGADYVLVAITTGIIVQLLLGD